MLVEKAHFTSLNDSLNTTSTLMEKGLTYTSRGKTLIILGLTKSTMLLPKLYLQSVLVRSVSSLKLELVSMVLLQLQFVLVLGCNVLFTWVHKIWRDRHLMSSECGFLVLRSVFFRSFTDSPLSCSSCLWKSMLSLLRRVKVFFSFLKTCILS